MKDKIIKFLLLATDWELFKKPKSTEIREKVVRDILSVDAEKWFHPKLPNGEIATGYGTIETVDGEKVFKGSDDDLYHHEHPNLDYRIADYPLKTCKEGEFKNVTSQDCQVIRDAFYNRRDSSKTKQVENSKQIVIARLKYFAPLFAILAVAFVILGVLLHYYAKLILIVTFVFGGLFIMACLLDHLVKVIFRIK